MALPVAASVRGGVPRLDVIARCVRGAGVVVVVAVMTGKVRFVCDATVVIGLVGRRGRLTVVRARLAVVCVRLAVVRVLLVVVRRGMVTTLPPRTSHNINVRPAAVSRERWGERTSQNSLPAPSVLIKPRSRCTSQW